MDTCDHALAVMNALTQAHARDGGLYITSTQLVCRCINTRSRPTVVSSFGHIGMLLKTLDKPDKMTVCAGLPWSSAGLLSVVRVVSPFKRNTLKQYYFLTLIFISAFSDFVHLLSDIKRPFAARQKVSFLPRNSSLRIGSVLFVCFSSSIYVSLWFTSDDILNFLFPKVQTVGKKMIEHLCTTFF